MFGKVTSLHGCVTLTVVARPSVWSGMVSRLCCLELLLGLHGQLRVTMLLIIVWKLRGASTSCTLWRVATLIQS